MARRDASPDFIEALARGLDVIRAFEPRHTPMPLAAVAAATGLARPTARRILLTLEQLGYVRAVSGGYELTPRVLQLGMSYVLSRNLWEVARPHMEKLVARTHESSSIAQLDGSDIVYVARVAVPKIVALAVTIGTRFPAMQTSLGKVLLAALPPGQAERVLAEASRSGIVPRWQPSSAQRAEELREVRARGWAFTDEQLAPGIRSVAAPLRDGDGNVIAALNVNAHAAETTVETLTGEYLPMLLQTAGAISADWAACQAVPQAGVPALAVGLPRAGDPAQAGDRGQAGDPIQASVPAQGAAPQVTGPQGTGLPPAAAAAGPGGQPPEARQAVRPGPVNRVVSPVRGQAAVPGAGS
jgi:IclR family transcriptional regulator, pca regulon regulatory protein